MQQALTDLAVEHTDQEVVGLQLRAIASDPRITFGSHLRTRPPTPESVLARVPTAMRRSYLAPVLGYTAVASVPRGEIPATDPGSRSASTGEVRWRDHACDHLTFRAGGCPARPGDVAISEADARVSVGRDLRDQTRQSHVTVPLLMAQLGLLALVVLWLVLLAVTEQRRPEVALARLRGRGRRGARRLLLGELLPVALVGVVPGAAVAVLGAWAARAVVLPGHAPFELGRGFVAAVALAVVVLTVVTVLAVSRVARDPVATLLRRVLPRRAGWALGVGDALVVAAAGAVVVLFATGGLDGPVALAAPGLLAVVVGLVLAHLTAPSAALVGRGLVARDPDVVANLARTITIRDGRVGDEGRSGEEYAVVTPDGFLPLPLHVRDDLAPGTLVRFHLVDGSYVLVPGSIEEDDA